MTYPHLDTLLVERRGPVGWLINNRPDRLNAWTTELEARYFGLLERCDGDPEVRVIIVTGAGKGFCEGADMDMLRGIGSGSVPANSRKPQTYPLTIRKPILAAINGACAGLGLVHALMCDLRFATAGAKFTTAFVRRGLIAEHLQGRHGHFMPAALLQSQIDTLEEPDPCEDPLTVDVGASAAQVADEIIRLLGASATVAHGVPVHQN